MTTTKFLTALMALISTLFLMPACDTLGVRGSGDPKTETRSVKDFHALEVNVNGDIEVRIDSVFKVEVTCEENIIDYLETEEKDGVLKIRFDRNVYDVDKLKIRVSAPSWDAFEVNGSADVTVYDDISGTKLQLDISGSGDLDIVHADFSNYDIQVSGSGDIHLDGTGNDLKCSVSGSGEVDALGCPVKTADINVSGSGDVRLDVSDELKVNISGSGVVEYKGEPEITKNISGSGAVRKI